MYKTPEPQVNLLLHMPLQWHCPSQAAPSPDLQPRPEGLALRQPWVPPTSFIVVASGHQRGQAFKLVMPKDQPGGRAAMCRGHRPLRITEATCERTCR